MPIQTVDTDRLYRKIARQLSELIAAGEFTPGQRLPAERELAVQLGVSRPSVREALIALEIEGKVEVRVGAGVFVLPPRPAPGPTLNLADEGEGPFELLAARSAVEGEAAAWAVREATPDEVAEIRASVEELAGLSAADPRNDAADRRFHMAIAHATHNGPMAAVIQQLWDQGRGTMWRLMELHFQTPALRAATVRDHRAIARAVEARDARAARAAMHRHLKRVAVELARGWEHHQAKRSRRPAGAAPRNAP